MGDSTELYYAHMEADRNEAEDAYFAARPQADTHGNRAVFRAGFERAYAKLWPLAIIQIDEQQRAAQETEVVRPTKLHEMWCGWRDTGKCNCGARPSQNRGVSR